MRPTTGQPAGPDVTRHRGCCQTETMPINWVLPFGGLQCIHGKILLVDSEVERRKCRERSWLMLIMKQFKISCCWGPQICHESRTALHVQLYWSWPCWNLSFPVKFYLCYIAMYIYSPFTSNMQPSVVYHPPKNLCVCIYVCNPYVCIYVYAYIYVYMHTYIRVCMLQRSIFECKLQS